MAIKSQNQVTIIDITDAYSAILTNENQTFAEASSGSGITIGATANTSVQAWRGSEEMYVWVNDVSASESSGYISISHGSVTKTTKNLSLTITFGITGHAINTEGTIDIPILVFSEEVSAANATTQHSSYLTTLHKVFSYSIARYGNQGASPTVYELDLSNTAFSFDNETGTPSPSAITIKAVSIQGSTRANFRGYVEVKKADNTDKITKTQIGVSGTDFSCSTSSGEPETLYYTVRLYETSSSTSILDSQTVAINRNGANGADGEDAYALDIVSSGGLIFKNDTGSTVLTAHVYKGGEELTSYDATNGFGTSAAPGPFVNWYDGNTCIGNGLTYPSSGSISASTIQNTKTYTAKLEDTKQTVSS